MIRDIPIPESAFVLHLFDDDKFLKSFPRYKEAKAGKKEAAFELIREHILPWLISLKHQLPKDAIYIAPFAKEATGDNAIPQILADACALIAGAKADTAIVQTTRVFHTGADPMERLISRPKFEGKVSVGESYVLVDDVSTMGGTLAELSNYIESNGGKVAGLLLIVNAGRDKMFAPSKRTINKLKERYKNEIREIFNIEIEALTANEANYLIGFRTADEIRNRRIKAEKERDLRLRSKGIEKTH